MKTHAYHYHLGQVGVRIGFWEGGEKAVPAKILHDRFIMVTARQHESGKNRKIGKIGTLPNGARLRWFNWQKTPENIS